METKRRSFGWQRRLWAMALAAVLVCIPMVGMAQAAPNPDLPLMPDAAAPKPTVTIQGNVVVEKNKPTGFYELALCVKTARDITNKETGLPVTEAEYAKILEEDEKNGTNKAVTDYDIKNYPFQSAAATVHINLDALTAVTWGSGKPIYNGWTATSGVSGAYEGETGGSWSYPRGIKLDNPDQPNIFTDLSKIIEGEDVSVRLDTANPDEMTNTTALIERYDRDSRSALLTLTANTTTTNNVIYHESTPVVVVRFAYDLNRFRNTDVTDTAQTDFWVGLDRNDKTVSSSKAPLTYLAASDLNGTYTTSDAQAAEDSSVHQTLLYAQNMIDNNVGETPTHFYYYLGAEELATEQATQTYWVWDVSAPLQLDLTMPKTKGEVVLANKDEKYKTEGDPEKETYSFFQNLLRIKDGTLRLELVNAETYRKSTGTGGTTILFYDWDDSLIGSTIVSGGDVRADVEQYIEENLVHPDLRPGTALDKMGGRLPDDYNYTADPEAKAYQELVNSLAREYSYRGKYPYTVGGTNDQISAGGEDFPLTNKLDYVFTKRVNTAVERTITENGAKRTETYVLPHKLTDVGMEDAALYPYVYGWAVVEDTSEKNKDNWKLMYDAKKIESTWTTIGVGELGSVTPAYYDSTTATTKPIAGGGAQDVYRAPQFLADADERWVNSEAEAQPGVDYTTKYAYSLASNGAEGYFRFMDFSNIDAELERYQGRKDTIIVKAVYEPGTSLLDAGYNYRMIEIPYYNKLNYYSAANGGAYSVEVTLERSDTTFGSVRGVTRVREPAVRQDTTYDQKWIQDSALGVDHNIDNASVMTARAQTETMFTKVDIDNGEAVQFTLSLSGRQNKVNYYIVEAYGNNFVAGGLRSGTNFDREGLEFTVDNYNYYAQGDSDESDIYYDVKDYNDRDGSHGFVLYGTLNNLMQYATLYNHGEVDTNTFNLYVTRLIMADANLRDSEGNLPAVANQTALRTELQKAARACEDHIGDPDYWNSKLDCAELTYHQLQWYIIDGILLDRETADDEAHKLSFCHLHDACASLTSNKPRSWEELITTAQSDDTSGIGQLTLTEIENLTHLRSSTSGSAFGSVSAFQEKFVAAVKAGNTDWVSIQKHILNNVGDKDTYWWFDGSTSNTAPTSLADLGGKAQYALHEQEYPDGTARKTLSKLASAEATWKANDRAGDNKVVAAWVNMTNNLVKAHHEEQDPDGEDGDLIFTHDKFPSFDEFITAYLAALEKAEGSGYGYGTDMTQPKWEGLQHAILHMNDSGYTYNNEGDYGADADYWWKDGKTPLKITSISTLLKAAQYINSGTEDEKTMGEEAMAKVTVEMLEGDPFYLRSTIKGDRWSEAPLETRITDEALRELIIAAQEAGATDWNTLQYYLVHKQIEDNIQTMTDEAFYYWWAKGGQGTEVDFAGAANLDIVITRLQTAALRGDRFGDPKAKGSVETQLTDYEGKFITKNFYELTHLTPALPTDDQDTVEKMTWYTTTDALLGMITNMVTFMKEQQGITGEYTMPSVDWYQVQYWILHPELPDTERYIVYGTAAYRQAMEDYWWYDKTEKPAPPPEGYTPDEIAADKKLMADVLGQLNTGDLAKLSAAKLNKLQLFVSYSGEAPTAANFLKILQLLYAEPELANYVDESGYAITWAQLEYYLETAVKNGKGKYTKAGKLVSTSDAVAGLISEFGWTPDRFPDGAINRSI